ncbi:MAG: hypothetical protein ABSA21_05020 [Candidatus Limnocylindrales bacterium]
MMSRNDPSVLSIARRVGTLGAISLLMAGCVSAGAGESPIPSPSPSTPASPSASAAPSGPSSAGGFYLRAWQTQALAPQYTFTWLPVATISDGEFIDGMVAVPAIYPGPLWVGLNAQPINADGIAAIVAEARKDGLLGSTSDFTATPMAGAVTAHIQMVVDGKTYELVGDPDALTRCRCIPDPGTSGAFAEFWQKLTGLAMWLPDELGQSSPYEPTSLAVLAMPATEATSGITPQEVAWPLATPFSRFGTAMGNDSYRCAVVTGADLAALEPVVKQANQLTRFVDDAKVKDSLLVRVMVPGEPGPCA